MKSNPDASASEFVELHGWQPIASVPLKTDVLLYWPAKMGRTLRPAQQTVGQVNSLRAYAGASHWAPLPSPPENREIEKLRVALKDAMELFGEIMRDEVNHQDEAEKWLRAHGHICPPNRDQ